MEMGLSNANAARRLNVSCSLVQRLWKQFQTTDSVSRRPVPDRIRVTTPAEDLSASLQIILLHREERSQLLQFEEAFIMQVCMQCDHLCLSL